jgi:dTDP-4-dehydrorhamnose reductase
LVLTKALGIHHVVNEGSCSWYEFARELFRLSGVKPNLISISSNDYSSAAKRPNYSVLRSEKMRLAGVSPLRHWNEALKAYFRFGESSKAPAN